MSKKYSTNVRNYIANLASSGQLDELVARTPRLEGLEAVPADDIGARSVLEKLALGAELTPPESFQLEAIIIPDRRPAVDIVGNTYTIHHDDWVHLNKPAPRDVVERAIPSIGRVELTGHPTAPYGGTGFVVGDDLMMTNRHVAELFATGLGGSGLRFITGRDAGIDFLRERGSPRSLAFDVAEVLMIHPYWDMALLRVPGIGAAHPPLKLGVGRAADKLGRDVAVIGYPGFDTRNPTDVQDHVFNATYYVKRLQPGRVRGEAKIESYQRLLDVPTHDASTLGGNSGSAIIDVETGEVVGLHFAGRYLEANYFVDAGTLAQDARVVDAGVAFAGQPQPTAGAWVRAWSDTVEVEQMAEADPKPSAPKSTAKPSAAQPTAQPTAQPALGGGVTVTLPLHITVSLGAPGDPSVAVADPGAATLADDTAGDAGAPERTGERPPRGKPFWDPDYTTRTGFETDFLGIEVPLPTPKRPETILDAPDGGKYLHYHHFSLAMDKARRLAAMSAAMVDFSAKATTPENRPPQDYTRDGLAGRSSDAWFEDDRIGEDGQLPDAFFTNDNGAFDRGHVVRRDAVAWGASYAEMRNANGDSFHSTNCSPQVAKFNQSSRGRDNWGDLENHVEGEAENEKLVVFAGPVFRDSDRIFAGVDSSGPVRVQIPESYWKLIVARQGNALRAFGFLLEQDLADVELEFFVPPVWRRFMVSVDQIEHLSGFDFADRIRAADQFETREGVMLAARSGTPPRRDRPAAATEALAGGADLAGEVTADWRQRQESDGADRHDPAVFVVELDAPLTDDTIGARLREALGLDLEVAGLFESDVDLDRFREVTVPGIGEAERADLFDAAARMKDVLRAASVEPDLDSRYFDGDVPPTPPAGTEESASVAFLCWTPEEEQQRLPDENWAIKRLKLPEAWQRSEDDGRAARGKGTLIFQPDTGVVRTHRGAPQDAGRPSEGGELHRTRAEARRSDGRVRQSRPWHRHGQRGREPDELQGKRRGAGGRAGADPGAALGGALQSEPHRQGGGSRAARGRACHHDEPRRRAEPVAPQGGAQGDRRERHRHGRGRQLRRHRGLAGQVPRGDCGCGQHGGRSALARIECRQCCRHHRSGRVRPARRCHRSLQAEQGGGRSGHLLRRRADRRRRGVLALASRPGGADRIAEAGRNLAGPVPRRPPGDGTAEDRPRPRLLRCRPARRRGTARRLRPRRRGRDRLGHHREHRDGSGRPLRRDRRRR